MTLNERKAVFAYSLVQTAEHNLERAIGLLRDGENGPVPGTQVASMQLSEALDRIDLSQSSLYRIIDSETDYGTMQSDVDSSSGEES